MPDFRSDTITKPTPAMREAMYHCIVGDDCLGEDPTVNELEEYAAYLLGKEAGLLVPSGTFSNQCAILTHTKPTDEVILAEDSHIIKNECGAAPLLSGVQMRPVSTNKTYITAEEIMPRIRKEKDIHYPVTGLICLEQATSFGTVMPVEEMHKIRKLSEQYALPVHVDGARFFNATTALKIYPKDLASCYDSINICLSKGLCAPVGSILAGTKGFIRKARINRKRMGGAMRQAGIIAACGLISLKEMLDCLQQDHNHATLLAQLLSEIPGITLLQQPEINMVFAQFNQKVFGDIPIHQQLAVHGIFIYPKEYGNAYRFVTHHDITEKDVLQCAEILKELVTAHV